MIKIDENGIEGEELDSLGYIKGRIGISRIILPVTRFLRAINAEKYIAGGERLLDIGCGDAYFIKRLKIKERYGLDKLLGDEVTSTLEFPDNFFDYVAMLAVIEHIAEPLVLFREICRVLKPKGRFIFTTPKKQAEFLLRLYARNIDEEHESYFDQKRVKELAEDMFEVVGYHTFIFGLNQAYCLQKNKTVYIGALSYLARFWLFSKEEIRTFGEHIKNYTQGIKVVKSHYHIGLAYMRSGQIEQGIDKMLLVIKNHPQMDRVS